MLETMGQQTVGMKKQAQELIEQAYQRGYRAGYSKAENDYHAQTEDDRQSSYEMGLNEAWEAAKKIYLTTSEGGLPNEEIVKIFDVGWIGWIATIFKNFSASEVVEKLKAYEKAYEEQKKQGEDSEIRVGDEVVWTDDNSKIGVVTRIVSDAMWIIRPNGIQICASNLDCWKKTGRTFPQIVEVLNKIKEGDNNV